MKQQSPIELITEEWFHDNGYGDMVNDGGPFDVEKVSFIKDDIRYVWLGRDPRRWDMSNVIRYKDYALMSTTVTLQEFDDAFDGSVQIIGLYHEAASDVYLVKRKVSKTEAATITALSTKAPESHTTITANMDYRIGYNMFGQLVCEHRNFKLECG